MIKLQRSYGNGETWVNLNNSESMSRQKDRTCIHFLSPGSYVYVEETPEQIISAWEEYQATQHAKQWNQLMPK